MKFGRLFLSLLSVTTLVVGLFQTVPANAQLSAIDIDFAAAEPLTYNHATGGGKWNNGAVNTEIERSLEGEKFACGDTVSYLTKVSAGNVSDLAALGEMTIDLKYRFTLDTTGQSGAALGEPFFTVLTSGDSAASYDSGSSVTTTNVTSTGAIFDDGADLFATVRLTGLDAGEVIIVRTDVRVLCQPGSRPTGNLQADFDSAFLVAKNGSVPVSPAEPLGAGARLVPFKNANVLIQPELAIAKTVTTAGGTCPGLESITIEPTETVRYCYAVTNPSNSDGRIGAPVYNLTSISDDSGQYPDFTVALMSGLTDIDSDGQVDDLAAGATATAYYEIAFDGDKDSTITNTASISGYTAPAGGSILTATDSATVFVDAPEIPGIEIQKSPDSQVVEEGKTASFSISVTNTGNVALTDVAVVDALAPDCDRTIGALAIGAEVTYTCVSPVVTASYSNVAIASGKWNDTPVSDSDSGGVTVDFLPKISVIKSASVTSVPETGGSVTFTVEVKNEAPESFTLNSLVDDKFGNLNGQGTCAVPQSFAAGATYTCTFTKTLASDARTPHVNVVTASGVDPEMHPANASDDATVTFTDVLPEITLTKSANPTAARWTGDLIDYTFTVTNLGLETVTITSFSDDRFALSPECLALIGQTLAPSGARQCLLLDAPVSGLPGGSLTNTATVIARDNEMNTDTATASATIKFWWYGRTPGYWKNHPEAWPTGYLPTAFIQDIFQVPTSLKSADVLNLDRNPAKDTLMAGLSYQGGSTLRGGAQILFRAAIAALLNEAYYGADFPAAASPAELITMVNTTLASESRAQYVTLASLLDYWNNAVHASLP